MSSEAVAPELRAASTTRRHSAGSPTDRQVHVANTLEDRLAHIAGVRPIGGCHQLDERLFPVGRQQADAAEGRDALDAGDEARVDAHLLEALDGERAVRVVADAPEHAHPRAEASKRGRDVSRHAARRFLLHDAVHLPVPGRQPIDLDQHIDVEVPDTEEEGKLFGRLQGGAQASALSAPVI